MQFRDFSKITAFWENPENFGKTSPFRNRVAKLRGPSEGLGGNAANVWSTQLQAVEQWGAMWYFHITSTRDIFRSERWRNSQMKIVLTVWKMQTPCCHVLVQSVCLVEVQRAGWLSDENMLQFWCCRQCWLFLTDFLAICGYNCCKVRAIWGNLNQFWAIFGNFMQLNFMQFGAI